MTGSEKPRALITGAASGIGGVEAIISLFGDAKRD